ncbi:MAG: putative oxidoreductase [Phycisphaerae bacterium]|nr:putative oxidoreductase [Phycisphaerae bacterium]
MPAEPRRILITGASNETGPHIARAFARTGDALALTYHTDRAAAERVAGQCRRDGAASVELFPLDLLDLDQCVGFAGLVAAALGGLDMLVANAAAGPSYTPLREVDAKTFSAAIQGQLTGNLFLCRDAGNLMKAAGRGRIILFSATSAHKFSHASYGLAKAAVNEMTRFLAFELSPEVTVNTIVPGLIDLESTDADLRRTRAANTPLGRIVTPDELAAMCVTIASPVFDVVTGQVLYMDGGYFLKPHTN